MPPSNDNIANAIDLGTTDGSVGPISIDDATRQGSEPEPLGAGSMFQTIWFKFTATATGTATFSTYGSIAGDVASGDGAAGAPPYGYLDTQIAIYGAPTSSETGFANLSLFSDNDDHPNTGEPHTGDGDYWSYVTIGVLEGVVYYVQVGTFDTPYTGTVSLAYTFPTGGGEEPPPGLECIELFENGSSGLAGPSTGSVNAYHGNTIFPANPAPNSLIIAVTSRWQLGGGTAPPGGTLSGFGATWTNIYTDSVSGNGSTGVIEVWVAMQATFTSGHLTYSFTPGAPNGPFDTAIVLYEVEYMCFTGIDPLGLADNGLSAIRNVTHQGPTSDSSPMSYSQATLRDTASRMWSAFYALSRDPESDFAVTPDTFDGYVDESSGATSPVSRPPQFGVQSNYAWRPDGSSTQGWSWTTGASKPWIAASLEILADPLCAAAAYWGINATTPT